MMLHILSSVVDGRNAFLSRGLNRLSNDHRDALTSRYFLNELCILEISNRIFQNHIRNQNTANAAATLLTMNIPLNFMDPVAIRPTAQQIAAATEDVEEVSAGTVCAICQDSISGTMTRIQHCSHSYHRNCLESWFTMSPRCPVCRHDIRGDPAN